MNTPTPIRACFHCTQSDVSTDADMICVSPHVKPSNPMQLPRCIDARSLKGPCGPEARFWQVQPMKKDLL